MPGHRVVVESTCDGNRINPIPARLDRGETFDVVIVAGEDFEPLVKAGRIRD